MFCHHMYIVKVVCNLMSRLVVSSCIFLAKLDKGARGIPGPWGGKSLWEVGERGELGGSVEALCDVCGRR